MNLKTITDFIIKTVQEESILSGFQYIVDFSLIEDTFQIKLSKENIELIESSLSVREEIADVQIIDGAFDVIIYTDYALRDEEYKTIYPKDLKDFFQSWQNDFKADLSESIENDISNGSTLKESILIIIKEIFPIWLQEAKKDTELIQLYDSYKSKLKEIYKKL